MVQNLQNMFKITYTDYQCRNDKSYQTTIWILPV